MVNMMATGQKEFSRMSCKIEIPETVSSRLAILSSKSAMISFRPKGNIFCVLILLQPIKNVRILLCCWMCIYLRHMNISYLQHLLRLWPISDPSVNLGFSVRWHHRIESEHHPERCPSPAPKSALYSPGPQYHVVTEHQWYDIWFELHSSWAPCTKWLAIRQRKHQVWILFRLQNWIVSLSDKHLNTDEKIITWCVASDFKMQFERK